MATGVNKHALPATSRTPADELFVTHKSTAVKDIDKPLWPRFTRYMGTGFIFISVRANCAGDIQQPLNLFRTFGPSTKLTAARLLAGEFLLEKPGQSLTEIKS